MIDKKYIKIIIAAVVLVVVALLFVAITRIGKVSVMILASPENADVYIDGAKYETGTIYLVPGRYTISGTKQGWMKESVTTTVSEDNKNVALILNPDSDEAETEVNEPGVAEFRESLAGIAATNRGYGLRNANPIIEKLPYSDIAGPFKIDFGYNQDNHNKIYLIVSYSSSRGRVNAINWLRHNKVDLTLTEIVFEDFTNPATPEEVTHE